MRGPPVGRQLGALLLVLLSQTATSQLVWPVAPWDCTRYPFPIQIMKGDDDDNYRTMQLNLGSGDFEEIWQWPANTAQLPTARLNAQGYNINDNIAYGLFSTDPSSDPGYFCRFSDVRSSTECLCEARGPVSDDFPQGETPYWGNAATITRNGTYYLGHAGGEQIHKLPAVHSLTSPGDSLEYQTTDCNMTQVLQGRGSGTINVESWNLTAADMYDAYGLPNNCKGQCYMAVWTNSTVDGVTKMTTWTPGDQNFADFIDFEYSSSTYLIGLGSRDASVWIIKLDGAGDVEGYSYSRVVVDYTGSTSSKRNMNGFGAGFRYGDRIYFASNSGSGIFEVELTSLTAVLDRTGDDACAFEMRDPPTTLPRATTGKRVCAQVSGTTAVSPAPIPITLKWVAKAVDETQLNDGFNCPNATDPFTAPRSPPSPPLLPPPSPVGANGDPHLVLAHGGKADFRGTDKGIYNFLSAKNLSLNVMTELADFYLHDTDHPRHKLVHGSFLTQAHVVALTGGGRTVRASYWASKIGPLNIGWINATIDNQQAFSLGPHTTKVVDDVSLHMDYSSLHVTTGEWELAVMPQAVQRSVAGPARRIDVQMTPRVAESKFSVPPHGVIGQSWDGDNKAVFGEEDEFPVRGEYTTSAMAEGAVEGVPTDYLMSSPYATDFKYSRFGLDHASPRDVSKLTGRVGAAVPLAGNGAGVMEKEMELLAGQVA